MDCLTKILYEIFRRKQIDIYSAAGNVLFQFYKGLLYTKNVSNILSHKNSHFVQLDESKKWTSEYYKMSDEYQFLKKRSKDEITTKFKLINNFGKFFTKFIFYCCTCTK